MTSEYSGTSQDGLSQKRFLRGSRNIVFAAIMVFAAVLRVPGLFTDFWLDEIWSLSRTNLLNSPTEIFTEFLSSNNHHLNSLIFYLLGNQEQWMLYRLHSLAAGIGAVILAWFIAYQKGRLEAVIASLLTAGSYLMIHYSSEARGYAMVIFFALLTFYAAQRFVQNGFCRWAVIMWLCMWLGFLSHSMYVHVFIALGVWLLVRLFKTCKTGQEIFIRYIQCFGVPILSFTFFYIFIFRNMKIDGGDEYKLSVVLVKTLSYAGGGPASGPGAITVAALTACVVLYSLIWMWRKKCYEWIFYSFVIIISPVAVLIINQPEVLFVRYFLISIAFAYIAVSFVLADIFRRFNKSKKFLILLILLFLFGNGWNVVKLFKYGRGGYLEGLRYVASHSTERNIRITSDNDFRNNMLIGYYKHFLPIDKKIVYVPLDNFPKEPAMWVIFHRIGYPGEIYQTLKDKHGDIYNLVKSLPYSDLSGMHWYVYQKQG